MLKRTLMLGAGLALLVSSCAKAPDSIAPSYVSVVPYQDYTCQQLGSEAAHISDALTTASAQQEKARTNDVVGVLLIGLPVSSLSGDNIAPEIGHLKGQQEAVRQASQQKNCSAPAQATPAPKR